MPYSISLLLATYLLSISLTCQADTPPPLTLAKTYQGQTDLTQYWVSEKLDGVRAYWNGKQLISRQGNPFIAPSWFTKNFPDEALDGELWLGRGKFQALLSIVRKKQAIESEWKQVRYFIFDLPQSNKPFSKRLKQLQQLTALYRGDYLKLVKQFQVADKTALMQALDKIVEKGSEGLMLHHSDALYHAGRNSDLLKVKPYYDAEARVLAYIPGKGKYTGLMGAILVETNKGLQFKIGSGFTDKQRSTPPAINSIITYTYHGKTLKGIPRFASFLRIREQEQKSNHPVK